MWGTFRGAQLSLPLELLNMPEDTQKIPSNGAVPGGGSAVNPASLSIEDMARLLSAAGGRRVTPEQVQADIEAGAPLGPGGRLNLVHYTAWLVREVQAN
jgi:hypothetical protein